MNSLLDRIQLHPSTDSWLVEVEGKVWRFKNESYARLFIGRAKADEDFIPMVLEHHQVHNWELCKEGVCQGLIWQLIQGL